MGGVCGVFDLAMGLESERGEREFAKKGRMRLVKVNMNSWYGLGVCSDYVSARISRLLVGARWVRMLTSLNLLEAHLLMMYTCALLLVIHPRPTPPPHHHFHQIFALFLFLSLRSFMISASTDLK